MSDVFEFFYISTLFYDSMKDQVSLVNNMFTSNKICIRYNIKSLKLKTSLNDVSLRYSSTKTSYIYRKLYVNEISKMYGR